MTHLPRRGWTVLAVLVSLGLVSATLWTWSTVVAQTEDEPQPEANADPDPVPPVDPDAAPPADEDGDEAAEGDDKDEAEAVALPQPKPLGKRPKAEDFSEVLEVTFEKPFRKVRGRGAEGRFDVTARVKNISGESVKGPLYIAITGSTYESLEVRQAPLVGKNGDPMFEVIADGKSLSSRSTRGKAIKMSFQIEGEFDEETAEDAEIDHRLTRTGLKLAEPEEKSKVTKGRGRGAKNRSLPIPADDPDLVNAEEAASEEVVDIMSIPGVVGMSTGIDQDNNIVQRVMINRLGAKKKLPAEIDGIPVVTEMTWGIYAYAPGDPNNRGEARQPGAPNQGLCPDLPFCVPTLDLQQRFNTLIPLGAQVQNQATQNGNRFSVGTYGFLCRDGAALCMGSNNHVFARSNRSNLGEGINQNAPPNALNQIATLRRFVAIQFLTVNQGGANQVDAAIATVLEDRGRTPTFVTPCNGYGAMGNTTSQGNVGTPVAKCGRTTGCTRGVITSRFANVNIDFSAARDGSQLAGFINQIEIRGTGQRFSAGGDSGSGVVDITGGGNTFAGLLFAGAGGGGNNPLAPTFANPPDLVLGALGVSLIGVPPGCPTTPVPSP